MLLNGILGGILLLGVLIYWKGIGPWLRRKRERKEKELTKAQAAIEKSRKQQQYARVLRYLSQEWISVAELFEQLASAEGVSVEQLSQPEVFLGLEYGMSYRWVEKQALSYRLTPLGASKKK